MLARSGNRCQCCGIIELEVAQPDTDQPVELVRRQVYPLPKQQCSIRQMLTAQNPIRLR
jgi:hypothetical protein